MQKNSSPRLWTRDFTIITIGSFISMAGLTLAGFAISIMVLDYTQSTFLYVLYNVCAQLPMLICPLLAGPFLDRVSRKKVIYCLDFATAAIYLGLFFALRTGWFSYGMMLVCEIVIGSISSVYMVAYDSFYPNLITEGNYSKAYSISSVMFDLSSMVYPLAPILYDRIGGAPLFAVAAAGFFTAACFEVSIRHKETHMTSAKSADGLSELRRFRKDFRDGMDYIRSEKGLVFITLYFVVSSFVGGGTWNMYLPHFRNHPELYATWPIAAVTLYTIVSNFSVAGRLIGGGVNYKVKIPTQRKFAVALAVYLVINLTEGIMLYVGIPLMAGLFLLNGLLSVTSYNIRIAATQSYIPDNKRARFNGCFQMLCSLGSIAGGLLAGGMAEIMRERMVVLVMSVFGLLGVYFFMYRGRNHVAKVYNREV